MPEENCIWIDNEPQRKEEYRKILDSGDRHKLISLIKTLHTRSSELSRRKKKLHSADERILHDAENVLYDEFAYALEIPREQVIPYIKEHV
jgi:CarD family transcriptional regulator